MTWSSEVGLWDAANTYLVAVVEGMEKEDLKSFEAMALGALVPAGLLFCSVSETITDAKDINRKMQQRVMDPFIRERFSDIKNFVEEVKRKEGL